MRLNELEYQNKTTHNVFSNMRVIKNLEVSNRAIALILSEIKDLGDKTQHSTNCAIDVRRELKNKLIDIIDIAKDEIQNINSELKSDKYVIE